MNQQTSEAHPRGRHRVAHAPSRLWAAATLSVVPGSSVASTRRCRLSEAPARGIFEVSNGCCTVTAQHIQGVSLKGSPTSALGIAWRIRSDTGDGSTWLR
eukprot:2034118-Rhodomonas_salina.3